MAESRFVTKLQENHLKCSICLDIYTDPIALPCLHTFCTQCLKGYVSKQNTNDFKCPLCNSPTRVPNGDVTNFQKNFQIENIISCLKEYIANFNLNEGERQYQESEQSYIECPICCDAFTEPQTISCGHTFCSGCLNEWISTKASGSFRLSRRRFPCKVCNTLIVVPESGNLGYTANKYAKKLAEAINVYVDGLVVYSYEITSSMESQRLLESNEPKSLWAQKLAPIVPKQSTKGKSETEIDSDSRISLSPEQIEMASADIQRMLQSRRLEAQDNESPGVENEGFEGKELASEPSLQINPRYKSFGQYGSSDQDFTNPIGIACFRNKYIIVSDRRSNRVMVFKKDGKIHSLFYCNGNKEHDIYDICLTNLGNLWVATKGFNLASCYDLKGEFIEGVGKYNGSLVPNGITTNQNGEVIIAATVGYLYVLSLSGDVSVCFSEHNDGYQNATLKNRVTHNSKGDIIVTDSVSHKGKIFNDDFTQIRSFGGFGRGKGKLDTPMGVTCDKKDNIIICDKNNNRVQVFSSTGKFIKVLTNNIKDNAGNPAYPLSVSFLGDNEVAVLVVGEDFTEVRIYGYEVPDDQCVLS